MGGKKVNLNLSRIWLLVPRVFLKPFDKPIQGLFPSRSKDGYETRPQKGQKIQAR